MVPSLPRADAPPHAVPGEAADLVYQALLAPAVRTPHLQRLAAALQADGVALLRLRRAGAAAGEPALGEIVASWGIGRPAVERLRRRARALAGRVPDVAGDDMRTMRLGSNLVLQLGWRDGADGAIVAAILRRGVAAPFTAEDRGQLAALRTHVARAMTLACDLDAARRGARRRGDTLDALPLPLVIADGQGSVLFANRAARALPGAAGLRIMRGERLAAPGAADAAALRRALALTTDPALRLPAAAVPLGVGGDLSAQFIALDSVGPRRPGKPASRLSLMVLRQRRRALRASLARLAEAYRLTQAERRVLALMLEGYRAATAAARLGVALATVRTQLRSIYEKTGCRGRSALVALCNAGGDS
jgi:DNA-binding CsgD family transcriptional regulator/PAS domain-containing protein